MVNNDAGVDEKRKRYYCRVAKDGTDPGTRLGRGRREGVTTEVKVGRSLSQR
jgi:hypothetical protein